MKNIQITDKMYDQLVELAIEQDENLEVMACYYLVRGMGEIDRIKKEIGTHKAHTEFSEALLEKQTTIYQEALIMAVKDPTDYDKAKYNDPNKPARKCVRKPKPGQSQGAGAKGRKRG